MSTPSFREEKGRGDFFRENVCERRRDGDVGGENGAEDLSSRLEQRYYTAFARRQKGDGAIFFAIFRKNGRFAASGRRRSDAIFGERRRPNETKNAQATFVKRVANIGERREKRLARFGDFSYNASRESAGGSAIRRLNGRLTLKNKGLRLTAAVEIAASDERAGREDDDGEQCETARRGRFSAAARRRGDLRKRFNGNG